ncbi:MAG: DUF4276 family protein [Pyrinomonadaceae bacterium]|nr:DUF4276 family protein [Pyrinomonadaceae bacterium]
MVEGIRIYIEGDKKSKNSNISLREGFSTFFNDLREQARERGIRFDVILGGSSAETFKDFLLGVKSHPNSFVAFLIDTDDEVSEEDTPKSFLQKHQKSKNWNWKNVEDKQCQLMVQIMESWFLADVETLKSFYGQKFNFNAVPKTKDVEKVPKTNVENSLDSATKDTQKGIYSENKLKHGAELLTKIDAIKIRQRAKHCARIFQTIEKIIDGQ